ncbi:DUF3137 domain-containing protein [Mycoplasma sp. 1458C]|uniref:DUF3137 domain-containing protein n=1 Tax=Mycoplasma sp. 1458C TaxID=3401661 RepID=UPI003AB0CD6B
MKRVADFLNYSDFEATAKSKISPIIQELFESSFQTEAYTKYKKAIKIFKIIGIITLAWIILTLGLLIPTAIQKNLAGIIVGGLFVAIVLVLIIISLVFLSNALDYTKDIRKDLKEKLSKSNELYKACIHAAQPSWEYYGTEYKSDNTKYTFSSDDHVFTYSEYANYKPLSIANDARLAKAEKCQTIVIDGKYPTHISNARWVSNFAGTSQNIDQYCTVIKIDARNLDQKYWTKFSFFESFEGRMKKANLENSTFNKIFKLRTDDELKARLLFTPLAMENLTNMWLRNKKHISAQYMRLIADNDLIYISFNSPMDFAKVDLPLYCTSLKKVIKYAYKDIISDIYSLYFMLQLVYIPNYLY